MTVNYLHKALEKLIAEGHGRASVCVEKQTFKHNCESDGVMILNVEGLSVEYVLKWDNDADSIKVDSRGRECSTLCCVLLGSDGVDSRGKPLQQGKRS